MDNTDSLQQTNNSVSSAAAKFKSNQYKHPLIENIIKLNQMNTACGIITGMVMENKQPGEICDTLNSLYGQGIKQLRPTELNRVLNAYPIMMSAFYASVQNLYGQTTFVAMQGLYDPSKAEQAKIAIQLRKQVIEEKDKLTANMPKNNPLFNERVAIFREAAAMLNGQPETPDESFLDYDKWGCLDEQGGGV